MPSFNSKQLNTKPPMSTAKLIGIYTLLFIVIFAIIWGPMFFFGKTMIWYVDGDMQHYPFFAYEGEWLRSIFTSIAEGNPQIPMWDPAMGYGADVIITMAAYIGDPLNLLSAFVDPEHAEALLGILCIFRIYLAGLAFIGYVRSRGYGSFAVLLGSISYVFCGWTSITLNHPFFAYPLVFFPLLLWGADRIIEKRRPALFIITTALLFLTYFYFGYMACLFLIPYCLYRVYQHEGGWKTKALLIWILKFLLYLLVGMAISAVMLLPVLSTLVGSSRLGLERPLPLLYPLWTIKPILCSFGGITFLGKDAAFGVSAVCVLAIASLFSKKGDRAIKVFTVLILLMLFIPAFGKMMNGFAYYAERWVWAVCFYLAFLQVRQTADLLRPNGRCVIISAVFLLFFAICFVFALKTTGTTIAPTGVLTIALVTIMVLIFWISERGRGAHGKRSTSLRRPVSVARKGVLLIVVILCAIIMNWGYWYLGWSSGDGRQSEQASVGQVYQNHYGKVPSSLLADVYDDGVWRYDRSANVPYTQNQSTSSGLRSSDLYASLYNTYVDQFNSDLGITADDLNHRVQELRGRSWLESFLGMRYFLTTAGSPVWLPYGASSAPVAQGLIGDADFAVYENELALSLATLYPHEVVSLSEFEDMSVAERQELLFSHVVLDDEECAGRTAWQGSSSDDASVQNLEYSVASQNGLSVEQLDDGQIRVVTTEENATLTLEFPALAQSDTFIEIQGLAYNSYVAREEPAQGLVEYVLEQLRYWRYGQGVEYIMSFAAPDGFADWIYGYTPDSHLYGGKNDWIVNLGYSPEGKTSVTINFSYAGVYTMESMEVLAEPVDALVDLVAERRESPFATTASTNAYRIEGAANEDGYVLATIPWSTGWSATVDGESVEPLRADVAFMAVEVDEGEHVIELNYETPYLRLGAIISLAGLVALIVICIVSHRRRRVLDGKDTSKVNGVFEEAS